MKIKEINADKLSPAMRQYYDIKTANEDVIIFFRLGDFYEMFFEDAINVSRDLELTLTSKRAGVEERIPICLTNSSSKCLIQLNTIKFHELF